MMGSAFDDDYRPIDGTFRALVVVRLSNGFVARMSQIAFFTRDGDMPDWRSRISRPKKRRALIRATILNLAPMKAAPKPNESLQFD
jgi:hypothetical protein